MRKLLIYLMLTFPQLAPAQDEKAFESFSEMLITNASYKSPAAWEGSQRLRQLCSDSMAAAQDPIKKAEWLLYRALPDLKLGNYDRAFADYEAAVPLNPKSRGETGWRYLFLLRDYGRALAHLTAFDALTPDYDDPIDDYSVNYLKGRALAGLEQYQPAIAAYTIAIDTREKRHGSEWVDYRYRVARSASYLDLNKSDSALLDLDKALKNYPKSAMAHYHRGRALAKLNRTAEAQSALRDALFFVRSETFERDFYYEQPDAAYETQIERLLKEISK